MEVQTSAIVLSYLKYGDNGLVVRCYTEKSGAKSFIVKNAFSGKRKKASVFTALNQVHIIYEERKGNELIYPKEFESAIHYKSIYTEPLKVSVVLFLSEILSLVLKEEESNPALYHFIANEINEFDSQTAFYPDFHLWFLFNLTRYLGFYPHYSDELNYFDLANGISTNDNSSGVLIEGNNLYLFRDLISLEFPSTQKSKFNRTQRKEALEILIRYYELHISGFRRPKSLDVLHSLFE